jgi:GntR family transcriptional regulator
VDGEPLCIMVNYLNARFVPGLARLGLAGESLYATLEQRYRLTLERAEDTVEARECTEEEANVLGVTAGTPVIQVTRVTYLPDDVPLEVVFATSRADRYQYRVALRGRPGRSGPPRP